MEITVFDTEDVIVTSGNILDDFTQDNDDNA